jgi:hypothetical protein
MILPTAILDLFSTSKQIYIDFIVNKWIFLQFFIYPVHYYLIGWW